MADDGQASFTVTDQERAFYDRAWAAGTYSGPEPNGDESCRLSAMTALLDRYVGPYRRERRLWDVGCGRGWLTAKLSGYGTAVGVDPVSTSAEHARRLFPHLEFHATDSVHWAATHPSGYDVVVSSEVIEHVRDTEKPVFLRSLADLVAGNGYVLLTSPRGEVREQYFRTGASNQPVEDWVTARALDQLAAGVGLRRVVRTRAYFDGVTFDSHFSRLAHHWRVQRLRARRLTRPVARWIEHLAAIYQVVLYAKR